MITHKTSAIAVYQSKDYDLFSMIVGNRPLNTKKISRIINQIEQGNDMLQYYPIQVRVVGNRMDIYDGQHRFFIAKKLQRPVHYIIISEEKSMSDIANVNSNVEKWKGIDFINCYIQAGVDDYRIVKEFLDNYMFSLGLTLSLLHNGTPGAQNGFTNTLMQDFQQGTYKVKTQDEAVRFAEQCKRFSNFKHWRSRAFLIALYKIEMAKLITIDQLYGAFMLHQDMLTEQAGFKSYIVCLEQIINHGKSKRIIIA